MTALMETPEAHAILDWLEQDDVVKRHAKAHPEILEQLTRFRAMSETLTLPIPSATIPGPEAAQTIDMPQYQKVLAVGSDTITFV
jgi:hypothetical protein